MDGQLEKNFWINAPPGTSFLAGAGSVERPLPFSARCLIDVCWSNLSQVHRSIRSAMNPAACSALSQEASPYRWHLGNSGPYTAHFALPGSWFGQAAAFTRQPRRIGLIATRDTELLHLPLQAIDEIVRCDPSAWRLFGILTIEHLDNAVGGSDDLMIRDHLKRFVAVLLRMGNCRLATPRSAVRSKSISVTKISPIWPMSLEPQPVPSCANWKRTGTLPCHIGVSPFSRRMP